MALLAPILPLHDPNQAIAPFKFWAVGPKGDFFWLGTDHKGRDILSRLIWGSQRVLIWATLATAVAYVVGMLMGVAAGYLGGWWDEVISVRRQRPALLPGDGALHHHHQPPGLVGPEHRARGHLRLRARDHAHRARARARPEDPGLHLRRPDPGESPWRIMLVELLPNARGP